MIGTPRIDTSRIILLFQTTENLIAAEAEVVDLTGQLESLPQSEKTSYTIGALLGRLEEVCLVL